MRRPRLSTLMHAARLSLSRTALALGVAYFELQGAAGAMLAQSVLMFPATQTLVSRVVPIRWIDYVRALRRPVAVAAVMGLIVRAYFG